MTIESTPQSDQHPFPAMPPVSGIELGAVPAGLRYTGRHDLMMVQVDEGTSTAGLFTQNRVVAAPVTWSRTLLPGGSSDQIRALVVNAGNANAMTGGRGDRTARATATTAAELAGLRPEQVILASTGVIGETMAPGPIRRGLSRLVGGLSTQLYCDAAKAIMTTDTFHKGATLTADVDGHPVVINGIAKGSGMIAPNMATMLGFLFTDAPVPPAVLHACLKAAMPHSFNAISVDGDTSTNDCVIAFATGQAGGAALVPMTGLDDARYADFCEKFTAVCQALAQLIVRDGEGAKKFVTLDVTGAPSDEDALKVAHTIASSPLVKTAFAGEDPNWGRIAAAAGRAGVAFDPGEIAVWIGDVLAAHKGAVHMRYHEEDAARHMRERDIYVRIQLGSGPGEARVWTSDLTEDYVAINADYRS